MVEVDERSHQQTHGPLRDCPAEDLGGEDQSGYEPRQVAGKQGLEQILSAACPSRFASSVEARDPQVLDRMGDHHPIEVERAVIEVEDFQSAGRAHVSRKVRHREPEGLGQGQQSDGKQVAEPPTMQHQAPGDQQSNTPRRGNCGNRDAGKPFGDSEPG